MKISVVGTGYVGLVTAVCLAEMGNTVTGIDIDAERVRLLNSGVPTIYEAGLSELLAQNLKIKKITFSSDISLGIQSSDILFIAIGTPQDADGSADLKSVLSVAERIGQEMTRSQLIVVKSTVPPGTQKLVKNKIQEVLKKRNISLDFEVASNPEFLREGTAVNDFLKPDRIILGVDSEKARQTLSRLYQPLAKEGSGLIFMDPASSEMTKYAANSMLAAKISLMNELSRVCEKVGADIELVREGVGSDHRIGPHFLYAGVGYGGSCLSKDINALIKFGDQSQIPLSLLKSVQEVNQNQRIHFFEKIRKHFQNDLKGKTFAFWGVSFKPGTDDIREAPALDIIRTILDNEAHVRFFDPAGAQNAGKYFEDHQNLISCGTQYEALQQADALVVMTEWMTFLEPDFDQMKKLLKNSVIFDARNIYSPSNMEKRGFKYYSVGRGS